MRILRADPVFYSADEYELDEINKNPCMETMVTIIKRLHNVIAKPENYQSGMPEWMTALSKVFNAAGKGWNMVLLVRVMDRLLDIYRYTFECASIHCPIDL